MKKQQTFSINEAAIEIERSKKTLMRWEEEGVFKAKRDGKGWRYYTAEDIETLKEIKKRKEKVMFSGGKDKA